MTWPLTGLLSGLEIRSMVFLVWLDPVFRRAMVCFPVARFWLFHALQTEQKERRFYFGSAEWCWRFARNLAEKFANLNVS